MTSAEFRAQLQSGRIAFGSEHDEQVALFEWARAQRRRHPELELLFAVPNGGLRDAGTAAQLRKEGVRAGVPDVVLPVARGGHGALFVEMKHGKGRTSKEQDEWIARLRAYGNAAVVCRGWIEASETITRYLKGEPCE